ncbi:DnaA ATPase domain-containing protein [Megalodesulfovibrio gigas]|uniref:DnaA ATPase domain-containing protein n=1 Tax=Megalodesulfovibrio gigas TaxID=879 RepID=UPI000412C9F4|nr:DnaA/Hda family protein [Megalodesulfovibrio gigas]
MKSSLRQHLSQRCPEHELRQWFDPLRIAAEEDEKRLMVTFPHGFFADWFRTTVQDFFEAAISQFLEPGYTVEYTIGNATATGPQVSAASPSPTRMDFPFGREFTFETFISNKKNYFPVASAKSVAKNQDAAYNPFCICGDSGSGKTHLMRAIANEVSKTCDKEQIFFGATEDVASLVATARREGGQPRQVLQPYRYLFVDDFHRVRDNFTLQEEFIQIFDAFHNSRRQMVFSCPEKVTASDYLLPALKSRLEWGLVVLLARQDVDIRARYIQRMCDAKKVRLTKEQMLTLAQRFEDFRYLQGIMLKLFAFRELVHRDMQDEDFTRILEYTENRPEGRLSAEEIQTRVAEHFGLTVRDLVSDRRQHPVVFARQVAMYLCRELAGISYPGLGRLFGGKDHSTAMYAVRKVAKLQKENKDVRAMITQLKKKCS